MGLQPGDLLIDDHNFNQYTVDAVVDGEKKGRGLIPRDFTKHPHGSMEFAQKFDIPVIPRSEWSARIKEKEEKKALLSQIMKDVNVPSLNQGQTNYCWFNGVVTAMYALRAFNNLPFVELSPASGAAPIKNFRNEGGWGGEALEWIVKNGVCRAELWPPNAIDRKYYTDEAKKDAATRKITEWYDLKPRNFDEKMTCLLLDLPVPSGYNHWSHETCGVDPVEVESGSFGSRERNSWGESYGDKGFFVFRENKSNADDACAPRVVNLTIK